jgi:hypothetical protein
MLQMRRAAEGRFCPPDAFMKIRALLLWCLSGGLGADELFPPYGGGRIVCLMRSWP